MEKLLCLITLISGIHTSVFASPSFCKKCEKIREYHRTHPSKYTYYEDYLKDKENGEEEEENDDEKDFILPDDEKTPQNPPQKNKN